MTKSVFKEEEKKYIPLIEGLPMSTPINAQGSAQVGLGVQVKSVFNPIFKPIALTNIKEQEETKKEEPNAFDTLNESIEKNYKQYQNMTKKLESYQAEYDYAPDNIKPSLASNFNKLVGQHNDLIKQLQGDIGKRDQMITTTNKINFMKYKQLTGLPGEAGYNTPIFDITKGVPKETTISPYIPPNKTLWNKIGDLLKGVPQIGGETPEAKNAKAQVSYNISQETKIPINTIEQNLDKVTKQLGIRGIPTTGEYVSTIFKFPIMYGLIMNPISAGIGITEYLALTEGINYVGSKMGKWEYKFGEGKGVKDLLPEETSQFTKDVVGVAEFLGKVYLIGKFNKSIGSLKLWDKFTKEATIEYKLPEKIYISAEDSKLITIDEFNKMGIKEGQVLSAREQGIDIEMPLTEVIKWTDKSWFAKLKGLFGIEPSSITTVRSLGEKPTVGLPIKGLLEEPTTVNLYTGLPIDKIVGDITKYGKVTVDMVKGLEPAEVLQIAQQLTPGLATEFLRTVMGKPVIPTAEVKAKEEVSLAKPQTKEEIYAEKYNIPLEKVKITELPPSKKEELTKGLEPELPEFKEEIEREPTAEELRIIDMERQIPENLKKPVPKELKTDYLKIIGKEVKLAKDKMKLTEDIRKDITPSPEILVKYPNLIKELSKPEFTKIEIPKVEIPESLKKPVPPELKNEYLKIIQREVKPAIDKLKIIKDIKENKPISEGVLSKYPKLTEKLAKLSETEPTEIKVRPTEELPEEQKPTLSKELKNDYLKIIGKDIKYTPDRLELLRDIRQDIPISEGLQTKYPELMAKIPQANFAEVQDITKRPPTAEKILGIEKAPLIARREDILLRQRIRDEARGAREGSQITREDLIAKFKSSQENIKNIKNDLIKYIDENLPTEAKGRLIHPLTMEDLTRKKAASIFSRVDRIKEDITRKELIGEIKELSVPKGNLAVDYQKKISETITGIDLVKPTQKTIAKLKGLRDFIAKNGTPLNIQSKYLEKLDRLTKKNYSQLSTTDLAELKDTLNQLQILGKLKQSLKNKYYERERKVNLNKLLNSTKNIDPKVSGRNTKSDIFKIGTKEVYMDTLHTPRVADMIDGFKGYKGENARYIKQLGRKETEAKEITRAIVNSALEEIQDLGIKKLTEEQQIRMMINIRYREGAFDQVKTLMEKNNLKEIPNITDQENKIIEIIKKYTTQYTDDIVAVFEEIENTPFNKLKEYILPIKYEKEFNLIPSQVIEQGRFRTTQTFKGFTFERQKGVEKTPRTDILAIFEEAINEQQWYLKMQPELENIKYLVKSKEYIARGGQMAANWWKDELDIVARRGWSATARSSPILRQARINLNQAILEYKISSVVMQPFAVFDAMAYAQSRYGTIATLKIIKEFSKAWIIPKYAKNIIAKSPALQQRQAGELAIEETLKKVGKTKGLWNSYIRGGMALLQKGDIITAAGVQKGMENILIKNKTPYVKEEAEFLMNLVSGSNEIVYRPHILAKGEGARTWFTFQTFFLNRWGILIHDLIQSGVLRGGGEAGWKRLWTTITALIGLGIFIAGSIAEEEARKAIYEKTTGKELPDESALKTAMMFIPEQIPYFGNLIEAADRGGDANPPVIRTAENFFTSGVSVIKGKTTETKIKGALRMTEAVLTLGVGVPGTAQVFDLLENIFKEVSKKKTGALVGRIDIKKELGIGGKIDIRKELGL